MGPGRSRQESLIIVQAFCPFRCDMNAGLLYDWISTWPHIVVVKHLSANGEDSTIAPACVDESNSTEIRNRSISFLLASVACSQIHLVSIQRWPHHHSHRCHCHFYQFKISKEWTNKRHFDASLLQMCNTKLHFHDTEPAHSLFIEGKYQRQVYW